MEYNPMKHKLGNELNILLVILFGLGMSVPVRAADFTFNVPLQLTDLHDDVRRVRVYCGIAPAATSGYGIGLPLSQQPHGQTIVNVVNNQVQQVVQVAVNVPPSGPDPVVMTRYICWLSVSETSPGGGFSRLEEGGSVDIWRRAKPGTLNWMITGNIPEQ
jgi:hypothetical protein